MLGLQYLFLALVNAFPSTTDHEVAKRDNFSITSQVSWKPIFQDKMQLDVVTVLLLLGEATIWKSIWTRFRFQRCHWKQWIYAISPGWAPLAGSLFAAMQSSRGPANLIYNRPPTEVVIPNLTLTNLNSGASHSANNVIIQNVYQAWYNGPRRRYRTSYMQQNKTRDVTKEVGIVDVDISKMRGTSKLSIFTQSSVVLVQLVLSLVFGMLGVSLEVFLTFLVTLVAQGLLLAAVTPRHDAWNHRDLTIHKSSPVMLHMNMDTTSVLFVRMSTRDGVPFSLEEYCWETQTLRNFKDTLLLVSAGLSFIAFAFQLILIGWMTPESRILFFILGSLGLIANAIEGAIEPDWERAYDLSFSGNGFCEPDGSSLLSAVGILLAGKFSAAEAASKLLYPDNYRFTQSRASLQSIFDATMCMNCRASFNLKLYEKETPSSRPQCQNAGGILCCTKLAQKVEETESKQIKDGVATVCHFLRLGTKEETLPKVVTKRAFQQWDWGKKIEEPKK